MKLLAPRPARPQGIALVTVISVVALMTVLIVAMLSISQTELKSAHTSSDGQQARQLSEVAVNMVISQLRKATSQNADSNGWEVWASQPGLVRRFSTAGQTQEAYKLYSSPHLVLRQSGEIEKQLLADAVPSDWQQNPHRYTDLNRPAVRTDSNGNPLLLFPILDPRPVPSTSANVGGFSFKKHVLNGNEVGGVVNEGNDNNLRVPMPVQWIYVLKDGSIGSLDGQNYFEGSKPATSENPIVGRVAFWTDDETSKININTASEPTAWSQPTFFYEQEAKYAKFQPAGGEFQRYPGHPATTALSPVLLPGLVDGPTVAQKESIYGLIPKVGPGGSTAGTKSYADPKTVAVKMEQFRAERLYASLDELLLNENRKPNQLGAFSIGPETVQRASFFLTAHGRAPESNPFGMPKIAVWPVSNREPLASYRTAFDQIIAHCSTLRMATGPRQYVFQRGWADSTSDDINFAPNKELLRYLDGLLAKPIPGFSSSAGQTFQAKYGRDTRQILVEIFDYIRSVNLHDGTVIKDTDRFDGTGKAQNAMLGYIAGSARPATFKTYTDPRFFAVAQDPDDPNSEGGQVESLGFPGHGQVTPSRWTEDGVTVQGIARFPTITEAGLHFICAADNTEDADNPFEAKDPNIGKPGGGSARKGQLGRNGPANPQDRWYSNFPPKPYPNPNDDPPNDGLWPNTGGYPYGPDKQHPGYKRANWNRQLVHNTPLKPGFRRVQARLLLEFFVPAAGYTILEPDLTVKVKGLSRFRLNGKQLFPNDEELFYTGRRATHPGAQMQGGYGTGLKGLLRGREVPARSPMPADVNWGNDNWEVKPSSRALDTQCVINYDLFSSFVDIDVGLLGEKSMTLTGTDLSQPVPVTLEVYSGHLGRNANSQERATELVQTLQPEFPAVTLRPPTLVRTAARPVGADTGREPPAWWSFYSRGAFGFNSQEHDNLGDFSKKAPQSPEVELRGRMFRHNLQPRVGGQPTMGAFFFGFDLGEQGAPRLFETRDGAASSAQILQAEESEGSDVVQTVMIRHGDYRHTAAKQIVPASDWEKHRFYGTRRLAHSFTNHVSNQMPGFDYGGNGDFTDRLVPNQSGAGYPNHRLPDLPYFREAREAAHRYGDFDNGPGTHMDGPYVNKPDEGNLNIVDNDGGVAYFSETGRHRTTELDFYSPNRMIPSPVMFGSLPTGVNAGDAWRTLLFRPQQGHPGGPTKLGGNSPADHLLLEFFWMPVVEPYAISEPFSTAGKINLNYQIFPFTHIRRATGMHAVFAGETIRAVPTSDAPNYKVFPNASNQNAFWGQSQGKKWEYKIDAEKTLAQFDVRFAQGKAFISPSEICDIYLVPQGAGNASRDSQMEAFWRDHRLTGDNTRERPYAGIYPRVTTRSNTFRVHYVAQTLKKARSSGPGKMDDGDKISGEFRGSSLIERHLDPTQASLPDFATNPAGRTLDQYHEFRVLQTKRFGY